MKRLLCLLAALECFCGARANEVLRWNALALEAVRQDNSGPNLSSRNFAILHTAIFEAVKSSREMSAEAAVAGASHEILVRLYPPVRAKADEALASFQSGARECDEVANGLASGRAIAKRALAARENDGIGAENHYVPSDKPGAWRRTPPFFRPPAMPHWRFVTPFAIPTVEEFVPPPPPALDSAEYAAALEEVKRLGAAKSAARTTEQTEIARFWSDFSYTSMPPGHWHQIAAGICAAQKISLSETARLFAMLSVAQADAAIVCWETKYRCNFWRPSTAITREANAADAKWESLLAAPPFPSYVSGHSAFSAASAEVLAAFFGTDTIEFTATSDTLPGVTRKFSSFRACADEIGMSRIYGGIHFSFDNEAGKAMGRKIGQFVAKTFGEPAS